MCPHEEKVTAWLLGDLPPGERKAMAGHLEACAACRAVRDELGGVLSALRSGLAKDGGRAPSVPRGMRAKEEWDEWTRRAALLAVSFGTLFSVLAAAYLLAGRARASRNEVVTHITFRSAGELAVPALTSVPEPLIADAPLVDMGDFKTEAHIAPGGNRTIDMPALPDGIPEAPRFFGLIESADAVRRIVAEAQPDAGAPGLTAAGKAKKPARRSRDGEWAIPAPPGNVRVRPVTLAGAGPVNDGVATNAASTNTVSR